MSVPCLIGELVLNISVDDWLSWWGALFSLLHRVCMGVLTACSNKQYICL